MLAKSDRVFRKTALKRLSSPERLDQVVRVIQPKDWLPLGMVGLLASLGIGWSFLGRIPITVTGRGVLMHPRGVTPLHSPVAGQLQSLHIQPGQCVVQDEVLATIHPSELHQQLAQEQEKLAQLQRQAIEDNALRRQRTQLEQVAISTQRTQLEQQLLNLRTSAPELLTQTLAAIATQRASLHQQLQDAQALAPLFEIRSRNHQELAHKGAISKDRAIQAEHEYRQIKHSIADLRSQLAQLEVRAMETNQDYLDNQTDQTQLQAQLDELHTRSKQIEQDNLADAQNRERDIQATQHQIDRLEEQIAHDSYIRSPQTGCVVEITASVGQVVNPGTPLGTIQGADIADQPIDTGVVYFAVKDGKQIRPGMEIFITPETVKRERFGSIVADVRSVSPLPITQEGANTVVGNPAIVDDLLAESDAQIEVFTQLQLDQSTDSGYRWSSSAGPDLAFTPGTTFTARVVVEEWAPITFLLPMLKEWMGVN